MLGFVGLFRDIWVSGVEMASLGDMLRGAVLSERRGLAAPGVNIAGWWWDGSAEDKRTRSPRGAELWEDGGPAGFFLHLLPATGSHKDKLLSLSALTSLMQNEDRNTSSLPALTVHLFSYPISSGTAATIGGLQPVFNTSTSASIISI